MIVRGFHTPLRLSVTTLDILTGYTVAPNHLKEPPNHKCKQWLWMFIQRLNMLLSLHLSLRYYYERTLNYIYYMFTTTFFISIPSAMNISCLINKQNIMIRWLILQWFGGSLLMLRWWFGGYHNNFEIKLSVLFYKSCTEHILSNICYLIRYSACKFRSRANMVD